MVDHVGWKPALTAALGKVGETLAVEQVTLTANLAYTLPAGTPAGVVHRVVFTQDGTGGHPVTYNDLPVAVNLAPGATTTVELMPVGAGYVVRYPASGPTSGSNTGDQDLSGLAVKSANLSDLTDAATARTNLGLGDSATKAVGTTEGTVKAGDWKPAAADVTDATAAGRALLKGVDAKAQRTSMSAQRAHMVDVRDYGAVGDGITDDTAAIVAALAAGKLVYFPAGTYLHTQPITPVTGQHLIGAGKRTAQLKNSGTGPSIRLNGVEDVEIRNLGIYGTSAATTAHGIEFVGASLAYITVDACRLHTLGGHGVYGGHSGHVNNVTITGTDFLQCGLDGINLCYGVGQINAIWIENCNASNNDGSGVTFFGNSVTIRSCTIQANGTAGISVGSADLTYVGYCFGSTIEGCYFELNAADVIANAHVIEVYAGSGVGAGGNKIVHGMTIAGNYFGEKGTKYESLIHVTDVKTSDQSSSACVIHTRSNAGSVRLLTWSATGILGRGFTIAEDVVDLTPPAMRSALPWWVTEVGSAEVAFSGPVIVANAAGVSFRDTDGVARKAINYTADNRLVISNPYAQSAPAVRLHETGIGELLSGSNVIMKWDSYPGVYTQLLFFGTTSTSPYIRSYPSNPEGLVSAPVGSLCLRTNGGTGTTLYVKESGTGNTGWVAK